MVTLVLMLRLRAKLGLLRTNETYSVRSLSILLKISFESSQKWPFSWKFSLLNFDKLFLKMSTLLDNFTYEGSLFQKLITRLVKKGMSHFMLVTRLRN